MVQFQKSNDMTFYIVGTDQLQLSDVIADELRNNGYKVQQVLNIESIKKNNQSARESSGTGFFVSDNGLIISCAHVVDDANKIETIINGKKYSLEIVSMNKNTDLALLKIIDYINPLFFSIEKFNSQNIGDRIYALGYPLSNILGSEIRVTDGIISSKTGIESDPTYFQISAPVQPGNSGGPIVNEKFNVIGVAASRLSDSYTVRNTGMIPQNINFGVKSDYVLLMGEELSDNNHSLVKTLQDAMNATIQLLINNGQQSNNYADQNLVLSIDYKYFWDLYYRLSYLTINIYNLDGTLVGQGRYSGDNLSTPEYNARALINEIVNKIQ
jgi:S1-C subfamily serine protease